MTAPHPNPEAAAQLARTDLYLQQDPDNPSLLARGFDLAMAIRDFAAAQRYLDRTRAARGDDPHVRFRQAELLSAQGRGLEAEPVYEALLAEFRDPNLAYALARNLARRGEHARAADTLWPYRDAAELPAPAATQLVRSLHHAGRGDAALGFVAQAEPRFGTDPAFCAAASLVALDEDDAALAARLSAQAQQGGAAPVEALVVDGTLALGELEVDAAVARFEQALQAHPDEGRSLAGLGTAHLVRRDFAAALPLLEAAHRAMPAHIGTLHLLAWCRLFMGEPAAAQRDFARALDLDRNFGESHGGLAVVAALRGARAEAEREAELALRLDPASLSARYARMVLDGDTADPERFGRLADAILARREVGGGKTMADLLRSYRGR